MVKNKKIEKVTGKILRTLPLTSMKEIHIKVSEKTHKNLNILKYQLHNKSLDETIDFLFNYYCANEENKKRTRKLDFDETEWIIANYRKNKK